MRRVTCIICLILIGGCSLVPHPQPWTNREKMAATFFIAAHTANAFSTEAHQNRPDLYYETNPIMGRHPSDTEIVAYFSLTGIGTLLIAHLYPELREPLLIGYGSLNTYMAIKDYEMMRDKK